MAISVFNQRAGTAAARFDNRDARDLGKLPSLQVSVSPFDPAWTFSHHAAIIRFREKWIAMWSSGRKNEDDPGQRVCFSTSVDFLHWSISRPLMDSRMGRYSECVLFANGFYSDGETLYAYLRCNEYRPELLRKNNTLRPEGGIPNAMLPPVFYAVPTNDGETWGDPIVIPVGGSQQAAFRGSNGRWYQFDHNVCLYSDTGNGLDWKRGPVAKEYQIKAREEGAGTLIENCGCETPDGIIHMLVRAELKQLWHSESHDGGKTWSPYRETKFYHQHAKFNFGRFPDGRYYIIANEPDYEFGCRMRLYLYLSDDGYRFDRRYTIRDEADYTRQAAGLYKTGQYGYPYACVDGEYLAVIYTRCKEVTDATLIRMSDIQ